MNSGLFSSVIRLVSTDTAAAEGFRGNKVSSSSESYSGTGKPASFLLECLSLPVFSVRGLRKLLHHTTVKNGCQGPAIFPSGQFPSEGGDGVTPPLWVCGCGGVWVCGFGGRRARGAMWGGGRDHAALLPRKGIALENSGTHLPWVGKFRSIPGTFSCS